MTIPYRVIFMGSPEFAVPSLRAVGQSSELLAVVTQPDRPQGRGQSLRPPPVKVVAQELGVPVFQPEKLRSRELREQLAALAPDLFVVVAYGKILSPRLLATPRLGCVNVHASLLPKFRGAAPIQWAVIRGERESGITIMMMDEGMDTGPTLLQRAIPLAEDEIAGSLHDRLAPLGADCLIEALAGLQAGGLEPLPQPQEGVSLAPMLQKSDGAIDFSRPAAEVDCLIRGLDPWPGAFCALQDQRLRLFASRLAPGEQGAPGEVLTSDKRGLLVACGRDAVWVRELQLPGRRRLPAAAVLAGHPLAPGVLLARPAVDEQR